MTERLKERILVVDDDVGFRRLLVTILEGEGYRVQAERTVADAVRAARATQFPVVLSDLKLPDGDGLMVLRAVKEQSPESAVIMITGFGTVATAVEAMKLGAVDYLGKPLASPDELRLLVRRVLAQRQVKQERDVLAEENRVVSCGDLVVEDPRMLQVLELVKKVAPTDATVLITGESGTGKEVVARCIHRLSNRTGCVFVPVNCAALTASLIESELFGHEKGAFTGAVNQHLGRFERAHRGTIFLDEIGELDGNLQAKLLRVLQERTLERVGGSQQIDVDVRVIAATNRNLKDMVASGSFREDLYYRLNLFPLELPALRKRPRDILRLANLFLSRAAGRMGKAAATLSHAAEEALLRYRWPGNVRELENLMERVAILTDGEVSATDLPLTFGEKAQVAPDAAPHAPTVRELEKLAILNALDANHGNRTHAARQLGISLRTLQYRLKEYGLGIL
jgi:two-component system, NtrC family, response regulator AtoC